MYNLKNHFNKFIKEDGTLIRSVTFHTKSNKDIMSIIKDKYNLDYVPQIAYHVIHDILEIPLCKSCMNKVSFSSFKEGYYDYCSSECMRSSSVIQNKRKKTQQAKFGGYAFSTPEGIEKVKQTNLERFGFIYSSQSPLVKSKISKTQQAKFGGYAFSTPEGIKKVQRTNLEKYGVKTTLLLPHVRDKSIEGRRNVGNFFNKKVPYLCKFRPTKIYILHIKDNIYKIGISSNSIKNRIYQLTENIKPTLVYFKEKSEGIKAYNLEQFILSNYTSYKGVPLLTQGNTELLLLDKKDLKSIITYLEENDD